MTNTCYSSPSGPNIADVSLQQLRALVLEEGTAYWNDPRGAGGATLVQSVDSNQLLLGLALKEPFGFMVTYGFAGDDTFVAMSGDDLTETTDLLFQGIPWTVPVAFLVSRQVTWEIVKEFCTSGQMYQSVAWGNLERIWPV